MYRTRQFASLAIACIAAFASALPAAAGGMSTIMTRAAQASMTPAGALQRLQDGNARFVAGKLQHRDLRAQAAAAAAGQYPFASIVSCVDSRTSSELLFDQGLGDIFNARIAGNIVDADVLGSLEFTCKAAGSKLIVVVGHTGCGAVKGAIDKVEMGNLTGLLQQLEPAVAEVAPRFPKRTSQDHELVDAAALANVKLAMRQIRERSPVLREMLDKGQIGLAGALVDLATGRATFIAD